MLQNRKAILTVILLIFTLVLVGIGVYVAIRIQQTPSEAPADTFACWCTGQSQCNAGWNWSANRGACGTQADGVTDMGCCTEPGSTPPPNVPPATQNKNVGDSCVVGQSDPATGGCDGHGPLFCYQCPAGTFNAGQGRCAASVQNANDAIALCGGNATPNACAQGPSVYCNDGIQNCGETGIDCGGNCTSCNPQPPAQQPTQCTSGANSCIGKPFNTEIPGADCRCVHQGNGLCGCIIDGEPGGSVGLGGACITDLDCGYSGSFKLSCINCGGGKKACGNPNLPQGACNSPAQGQPIAACGGALEYSINCAGCPSGSGRACTEAGWSACVRADACGYSGGDECDPNAGNNGGCPAAFACRRNPDSGVYQCERQNVTGTESIFVGCGNVVPGGNGNRCSNCYSVNGQITCFNEPTSCGAAVECLSTSETPVPPGTPPPPPASSTPYCGDAICAAGEACERVSPGSNTFAACSGATGAAPTGPNVSSCYGIELNQPDTTSTCQYCGDGVFTPGREQCDPTAPAGNGNNPTQCNPGTCTLQQTANQCIDLVENGVDPITTGAGNFVEYTLVYQNSSTTNPYPNIRLRVGPTGTPVGRDANNPGSALVSILPVNGYTYDPVTSRHTYRFRWEAVSTSGTPVTDGTYDVRVLLDGSNDLTEPAACLETLQTSSVAPEEPLFNIIKASAPVCEDNGNAVINYTLTVTNIGPVQGVIDFVRDDLDDAIVAAGITPTNINPSYGTYSNGVITWTGSVADRTFAAGQSKQYTYTVTIPSNQVINFISSGIYNQAQVQYDTTTTTDNVDSFDLRTFIECSVTSIPDTGIFDDGRFLLIGVILTILGILSYKFDIVKRTPHALTMGLNGNFSEVVDAFRPFEDRVERKTKKKRK